MDAPPDTKDPPSDASEGSAASSVYVDEYELLRPLGSGTMGQVYLAQDMVLGRRVAVKFISQESPSPTLRERFLVEARAIARLQHPNVVSIYRVGVAAAGPYIASEFVRGKSLDKQPLPIPWRHALDIGTQLSRGLAAAHAQGIIHRDLKPANVMLAEDGTAKLLDFGLAKLTGELARPSADELPKISMGSMADVARFESHNGAHREEKNQFEIAATMPPPEIEEPKEVSASIEKLLGALSSAEYSAVDSRERSLTAMGSVFGTPAYMAPEAWAGDLATERIDVYSLGALLYELCSGHPPHDLEGIEEIRVATLYKDVPPLLTVAPGVDRRFAAIIQRCLERDEAKRYPSGKELQEALEALATEVGAPSARSVLQQAMRRRWPVVIAASLLLLLPPVAALRHFYEVQKEKRLADALVKNRRSLAVMALKGPHGGGAHDGFATAFAELLSTELAIGERLHRIPADSVLGTQRDLKLVEHSSYTSAELAELRQHLGVDVVVSGSYQDEVTTPDLAKNLAKDLQNPPATDMARNARLRLHIHVYDAQLGREVGAAELRGSRQELFELVTRTGTTLRQKLGIGELSSAQAAALRASRPTTAEMAELYAQGLDKLRHFDAVGARKLLERVVTSDPDYPLGHLALADVFTALGYDERAKAEVQRSFMLSTNLPRQERYLIEARHYQSLKEWDKAFSAYKTLLTFFPESLEYGLYLARAYLAAGQPEAAMATTQALRKLPPPARHDPRLDIVEASSFGDRSDYSTALRLLEDAARKGQAAGAPLMVATARLEAAYALNSTGRREDARKSAEVARDLFAASGNRGGVADALMAIGQAHLWQCKYQQALEANDAALSVLIDIENTGLLATHQANMALPLGRIGNLKLALSRAEGSVIISREIGAKEALGAALIATGWIEYMQGHLARSYGALKQAKAVFEEMGDLRMVAWYKWHQAQVLLIEDRLAEAQTLHEQALAIREQNGLLGFAAESQRSLAYLALERGDTATAEKLSRQAAEQFQKDGQLDEQAGALSLLSEVLGRQARTVQARATIEQAMQLALQAQNASVRTKALSAAAKIYADLGQKDELLKLQVSLEKWLEEATAMGMTLDALELRMAIAVTESALGRKKLSQEHLFAVEQDATKLGLFHVSRKARSMLSG